MAELTEPESAEAFVRRCEPLNRARIEQEVNDRDAAVREPLERRVRELEVRLEAANAICRARLKGLDEAHERIASLEAQLASAREEADDAEETMAKSERVGIYREDGGEWRVRVHSDNTDASGMRRVDLECLAELRPSPVFGSIKLGGRWESTVLSGNEGIVGWSLTEEN